MNINFQNWNVTRVSYLVVSLFLIGAAFYANHSIPLYILGVGFLIQTAMNTGCSKGECKTPNWYNYRRRH